MAEVLTRQQRQAVIDRGGKVLVSAAAGSGKTKVLVDRLLGYLLDPVNPVDLDSFLIITYTKAAASELRDKIAKRITEAIAQNPENKHLQRQLQKLFLTKISTVHSFCTDILREYAYQLDISADFRVVDENESFELMNRVVDQVLEDAYENAEHNLNFRAFIDSQGFGRDDRKIPEILFKVYYSANCHLDPEKWLDWCVSVGDVTSLTDAGQTVWGEYLINDLHRYLQLQIKTYQRLILRVLQSENMNKVITLLESIVDQLAKLCSCSTWDEICEHKDIDYGRLVFPAKCPEIDLIEQVKAVRDNCKKGLAQRLRRFTTESQSVLEETYLTQSAIVGLVDLTKQFRVAYSKAKQARRVLDFNDLEQKTLDLLIGKSRNTITQAAKEIGQRYCEVMVDEYQDTNAVQDAIFNALTQDKNNCFMVGDVKQSIYQFRLADPSIFLEKYNTYAEAEDAKEGEGRRILLSSNFRSATSVIRAVNDVFSVCMTPQVGGLVYGDDEQLYEGIEHTAINEPEIELHAIEGYDDQYASEASFVASKIISLIDGTHMIRCKEGLRPITAEDIVILLRSPGSVGMEYQFALEKQGIRCVSGGGTDLLQTEEIEVLQSILQVINNPLQDIPLLAFLTSRVIGFTADEIADIRGDGKSGTIFSALLKSDSQKVKDFLNLLDDLRKEAQMSNVATLIMRIFAWTHMDSIYASLNDGVERVENLQGFCRLAASYENSVGGGLSRFLEHLNVMKKRGIEAPIEENTAGAVRIMSIHKSKGLEFPVVFLCGLSKEFNLESARAQVLCDKELGLGLSFVDRENAVRYPTIAKNAISAKIAAESISEELRVLYVAMTRAQDRLIMTYTQKNVADKLQQMEHAVSLTEDQLITEDVSCAGGWILQAAFTRVNDFWKIHFSEPEDVVSYQTEISDTQTIPIQTVEKLRKSLSHSYAYEAATQVPTKQTATQIKGRDKDKEAAEGAETQQIPRLSWRSPGFSKQELSATAIGTVIHRVMQYIRFALCTDAVSVQKELERLVLEGCITEDEAKVVPVPRIAHFFSTNIGQQLRQHPNVIREFKFTILDDGENYCPGMKGEKVLLQGVVDCAMIDDDGITIIDFKTDRVSEDTIVSVSKGYRTQVQTYAEALSRIYQKPVRNAYLYFFHLDSLILV